MSVTAFANDGNGNEKKADKKSETKEAAKTEVVKNVESPEALRCYVKKADGSYASCWLCNCETLKGL
jgi:hypothetical protein